MMRQNSLLVQVAFCLKISDDGQYLNEGFASTSKLSILNAGKGEYEALILDLLGID